MLRTILAASCLLITINSLAQNKEKKEPAPIDYKQVGSPMPALALVAYHDTAANKDTSINEKNLSKKKRKHLDKELKARMANRIITGDDLTHKANVLVMIFNPTCSHCDDETNVIDKNLALFKQSEMVFIANANMLNYIPDFERRHKITQRTNMYMGTDTAGYVNNAFLYSSLPQINIYSPEHKLLKIYSGEVAIDSLKQYIQ